MTLGAARFGLRLPAAIERALVEHAKAELPNEACGLLAGDPATGTVRAFHPARNEHASPLRFSVDGEDLVRITYAIEGAGMELLAIFHSHPTGQAKPSPTDIREAQYPDALHLLGAGDGPLRAWHVSAGMATEVRVILEDA